MTKVHKGHAATCLCCKHLMAIYDADYSDVTPGRGLTYECWQTKDDNMRFVMDEDDLQDTNLIHDVLLRALECNWFEGRD